MRRLAVVRSRAHARIRRSSAPRCLLARHASRAESSQEANSASSSVRARPGAAHGLVGGPDTELPALRLRRAAGIVAVQRDPPQHSIRCVNPRVVGFCRRLRRLDHAASVPGVTETTDALQRRDRGTCRPRSRAMARDVAERAASHPMALQAVDLVRPEFKGDDTE